MPRIDECLLEAMTLPGARGAAVVDRTSGLALGTIGEPAGEDHETTAAETAELARVAAEHPAFAAPGTGGLEDGGGAGGTASVEDLIVTTRTGYHLLRFVGRVLDDGLFVHLWLDRGGGNIALARIRLRHLAERLVLA
ncbi:hypothetical protein V1L54_13110 [Streptomyces sp. TRM 70361]|uniref:hypothetical protein n=1 Tax=Streptomyces sp. TRM 70361 TaxID=3116553 RepID=UPI002E7C40EF|nr:hypothetical protein [Streptomyces sp. TRM 70361]MEE1940330.1 hypothetical protein [Streptomyces sp. TRM 70361]